MAHALGASVRLITGLPAEYDRSLFEGISVHAHAALLPCRYANLYDAVGNRTQLLLSPGEPLSLASEQFETADAFVLAPAYHELSGLPDLAGIRPVSAVSLQGPLRLADSRGHVGPHPDAFTQVAPFIRPGVFAFFSEEDTAEPVALARAIAAEGATAVLTRGYRGAVVFSGESETELEAIPAEPVDPTGAGDCFSTAFTIRLVETGDVGEAACFALAAGSLAVEGPGIAGIPTRAQVEERLKQEAA
ncbi:MAG: carbohydrate kinase family protein [Tepidiformaceae bacterium]